MGTGQTVSNTLYELSAVEALGLFRARKLSPVELTHAVIERAEEVEPAINAFSFTFFDEAMEAAREAERRYMGKGDEPRAAEGIPQLMLDKINKAKVRGLESLEVARAAGLKICSGSDVLSSMQPLKSLELGYKVTVVRAACASVREEDERLALAYLERIAGCRIAEDVTGVSFGAPRS